MEKPVRFDHTPSASDVILSRMIDGVVIIDKNSCILYVNPAAEKMFSKSRHQLLGETFGYPIDDSEVHDIQVLNNGRIHTIQMIATPINWNGQESCLLSLRDITELHEVSRELKQKKARLERTNKELEQYASLASHDLKEPVRKMRLYTNRLVTQFPDLPAQALDFIQKISGAAERMQKLIAGIAEFSKLEKTVVHFSSVNLNEIASEVIQDLDLVIAEKKAKVKIDHLPVVEAVEVQMHQLLMNLISNAIKYSRAGENPLVELKFKPDGDFALITISDNGIGFNNRQAEKIFQPFHRLDPSGVEGTGIGLAICKKIIDMHSGQILVQSQEGTGTTFTIRLPFQQDGQ